MKNNTGTIMRLALRSVIIALVGVFIIDYFSHLLFSNPMETPAYFLAKSALYIVCSFIFLANLTKNRHELRKVCIAGVCVALIWGTYYNILPALFDFYPFGIPLEGLTFLGMGLVGTGVAFGVVHTLAFIGGYYSSKIFLVE